MWNITSFAPLRVSFAGGGTDIPPFVDKVGGAVINTTIDRRVTVRYAFDSNPLELSTRDLVKSFMLTSRHRKENSFVERLTGLFKDKGIDRGRVAINSDVPPGSGLGSSSALVVAMTRLLSEASGFTITDSEAGRIAYETERDRLNILLGKQDPYAIAIGGFKFMEFDTSGSIRYEFLKDGRIADHIAENSLLLYTGGTRESSRVLEEQVRKSRAGDSKIMSKMESLKRLSMEMWDSLKQGSIDSFYAGINRGWEIKKTLGSRVSNPAVDDIISYALKNGACAAKLLGGGSKGFILMISEDGKLPQLQRSMSRFSDFIIRVSFGDTCTIYRK
ncbi:MAG: kinase [Candidatus Thermoplasmatota archaeon]|jgi:D-glycero-alpha-D-manno-heptose-7-phosphate kinase|nr:kinase [Candidatus Thermoplasmatota archaeon]MCL5794619.1 kinase [Candidatus Thermoplasmatota archaeon]